MIFTRFVWEEIPVSNKINKKKLMYQFLNHVTEIVLILVVIWLWSSTTSFMKLNNWMYLLRSGAITIPLLLILVPAIGITGVQIAQPAADVISGIISIPFILHFVNKHPDE